MTKKYNSWQGDVDNSGRPLTRLDHATNRLDANTPPCLLCDAKGTELRDGICEACNNHLEMKCANCGHKTFSKISPLDDGTWAGTWMRCHNCKHAFLVRDSE